MIVIEEELQEIRKVVGPYRNENIYNIEESTIFWEMALDVTLSIRQTAKEKHDKAWITISLAYNVSRTDKLES